MSVVKITVDSTCDLSPELIDRHDITVNPLYTILGDKSYADGVDIKPDGIYKFVSENNILPKTSAASVEDYFRLLVLDAVDYRSQGMGAAEIAERVRAHVPLVRASFVIDNLEYLRMGGRCSAVAMLGANLLKIKPRIEVTDGKMGMGGKYRGAYDKVLLKYTEDMLSCPDVNIRRVFITHTKCDKELVRQVREKRCMRQPPDALLQVIAVLILSECFLKLKNSGDCAQKLYLENV